MADSNEFGDLLKKWRLERNWTLEHVAKKVGSHKGYVSGIENGKVNPPSVRLVCKFAKLFEKDEKALATLAYIDKAPDLIKECFASVKPSL